MCTSTGVKPARSKAAAISNWEFTPCSRSTTTLGRAPLAMKGAATSSLTSKDSATDRPGLVASASASNSCCTHSGSSRSLAMR